MAEKPRRKSSILGKIKEKLRRKSSVISSSLAGSSDGGGSQNSDRMGSDQDTACNGGGGGGGGIVQIKETDIMVSALSCHRPATGTDTGNKLVPDSELESELKVAFAHYSKGVEMIPAREIGYILRSLGQNPTEDDIIALVCEAGCDWEGYLTADDFLSVALVAMQKQVDRMDDVRAAFRAFDHNGDGSISRDELLDAMRRFGHSFSDAECDEMFTQADLNNDGKIDWDEFVNMMMPDSGDDVDYASAANKHDHTSK